MVSFDLAQLDYTTRFSLWQVKTRTIIAQTSDLDDALDEFGKKAASTWTNEEKRKDRKTMSSIRFHLCKQEKTAAALWLKPESICISKNLTNKMHVKIPLLIELFVL
jgi:hypothetical protein